MNSNEHKPTHWTGEHTTGVVYRVRDGLCRRFAAKNSRAQHSDPVSNIEQGLKWLQAHDTRR